jgi:hypothetical protein
MRTRKHVAVSSGTSARLKSWESAIALMDRGPEVFAKLSDRVTGGVQSWRGKTNGPCYREILK